jgi:spore coat polysaccharide biosynthesis protein SpsF
MTAIERLWQRSRGDAFLSEWFNHDLRTNPDVYATKNMTHDSDLSALRWTVDYPEDLVFMREVFKRLSPHGEVFHMEDVLRLLKAHPEIEAINASYVRDAAYHAVLKERMKKP